MSDTESVAAFMSLMSLFFIKTFFLVSNISELSINPILTFPLLKPMLHARGEEGFKVGYRFRYRRLLMLYLLDALGKEVLEGERGKVDFQICNSI